MSLVEGMIPVSHCRSSLEADLALWRVCGCDDGGWFLVSEWDLENNLGGERKGSVGIGELQNSDVGMGNFSSVRVEVAWFVLDAGVVVIFHVTAGWVVQIGMDFFQSFFSHTLFVSPLSIPLLRFVAVSISSGCASGGCCFSFSFFNDTGV